ncbi:MULTISPECIES: ABC transporter ATP-binding protein [unclassified Arthrobacter]|uniref:ABC transporter ATP-binding protein n=1 Tax=unclassified Arthrobacter TaxID=235627 RepID=UPI001D157472|nr:MULTISPECIES: ABC transporter ATP-binding protein [unclassified Arthrobacter]MCC3291039.1 ABC transporter ATP-binding protein [Arthrobacter sp. zg-Y1110]MCC3301561.1 ABC transporter ATP-binding protein [Arthrobacter sp. zg-Y895]UWX86447.1 ABC transporter ATP-binding protein [Arthrobacter sp. zg-Y1110]
MAETSASALVPPTLAAATAALHLQDVTLEYPDGVSTLKALDRVSLTVPRGKILSLVGPSGSGKSSLLAVAATLIRPASGTVTVGGRDVGELDDAGRTALRRTELGIVFQQANLLPSLTAVEQLVITDRLRGRAGKESESRARELLELVGLSQSVAARRPHQLSGGQRQRVNIARALMGSPSLLLVDEPTAALDHDRSEAIVRLLVAVTREFDLGTVMVTHDTEFVPLTDDVAAMRDGRLIEHDPAA